MPSPRSKRGSKKSVVEQRPQEWNIYEDDMFDDSMQANAVIKPQATCFFDRRKKQPSPQNQSFNQMKSIGSRRRKDHVDLYFLHASPNLYETG